MTYTTTNGISYISHGETEPTLVFLHYFGGAAMSWKWVIQHLQNDFRCIAIDLPGFGKCPPLENPSLEDYGKYLLQALTELDFHNFVLIGHSMGGKIALQIALNASQNTLQQIILIAPSPPTIEPMPEEEKRRLLENHPGEQNAMTTVNSATRIPLPEDRRSLALQTHMQAADSAWRWWLQTGMQHSIADDLDQIHVPVTAIASADDPVIPFNTIQHDVVELVPHLRLIKLNGVGHLMPLEVPEKIAEIIFDTVQESRAARH